MCCYVGSIDDEHGWLNQWEKNLKPLGCVDVDRMVKIVLLNIIIESDNTIILLLLPLINQSHLFIQRK